MASKPPCHGPGQASAGEAPSWALGRAGRAVGEHYGSAVVSRHKTEGIHHRLLVDRNTGRITQIELPGFRYYSDVSWYRDYAAYCAAADDGERVSAIVAQITTKKPIYKKQLGKLGGVSRRSLRTAVGAT